MNLGEEYTMKCLVSSQNDQQLLHVQVRSCLFQDQVYYGHFSYNDLSEHCRFVFKNISHLYVCMQKQGMVYFDDYQTVINVCVPIASEIREYSLPLKSKYRAEILNKKILYYTQQKAKIQESFFATQSTKEQELQSKQQELSKIQQQKKSLLLLRTDLENRAKQLTDSLQRMRAQTDNKMTELRKYYPNQVYQKYVSTKQLKDMQARRQFWIKDISRCNKREVRRYVNEKTRFDEQKEVIINRIELVKMSFVEVFPHLEIIDLSNNKIKYIEGLTGLSPLRRLNLSENIIEQIRGLQDQTHLKELLLDSNKIKVIENVFHLSSLQILSLHKNQIEIVPDQIVRLSRLSELHLSKIQNKQLTIRVEEMKNLKKFTVIGNRCYNDKNKSKQIINNLIKKGIRTTLNQDHL